MKNKPGLLTLVIAASLVILAGCTSSHTQTADNRFTIGGAIYTDLKNPMQSGIQDITVKVVGKNENDKKLDDASREFRAAFEQIHEKLRASAKTQAELESANNKEIDANFVKRVWEGLQNKLLCDADSPVEHIVHIIVSPTKWSTDQLECINVSKEGTYECSLVKIKLGSVL